MLANATGTGRMAAALVLSTALFRISDRLGALFAALHYWPPHGDDEELPLTDQQRGRAAA